MRPHMHTPHTYTCDNTPLTAKPCNPLSAKVVPGSELWLRLVNPYLAQAVKPGPQPGIRLVCVCVRFSPPLMLCLLNLVPTRRRIATPGVGQGQHAGHVSAAAAGAGLRCGASVSAGC